jgi:hypothetical protein
MGGKACSVTALNVFFVPIAAQRDAGELIASPVEEWQASVRLLSPGSSKAT